VKKREHARAAINLPVKFQVIIREEKGVTSLHLSGTIIDICDVGFSLITDYLLMKGHLLTITEPVKPGIPRYGIVRWVHGQGQGYKVGLSHVSDIHSLFGFPPSP
jgi:hypothetical protein